MNLEKIASEMTDTAAKDWGFIQGPDSRVGVDYWLEHAVTRQQFYANNDQGKWTFEVQDEV
jgi:hypothetical protein